MQTWDYRSDGAYFITICTKNREHYLGKIISDKLILSAIGEIVYEKWLEITEHFTFVKLDVFQIMPNHMHGIIIIDKMNKGKHRCFGVVETPNLGVSTLTTVSSISSIPTSKYKFQTMSASQKWNSDTLGVMINQFKRAVTIQSRKINPDFGWQSRFYDHIIRDEGSFERISNYIINNPKTWKEDQFYKSVELL